MPRGGARSRSGPPPDPKSARSEKLGRRFGKLPKGGFTGRVPAWPLTKASTRERAKWNAAWRTPQAAAWATEPWRHESVAMWVRCSVRAEAEDAPAAIITAMLRLADQIGMTPAGLTMNGWEIEEAPSSRAAEAGSPAPVPQPPPSSPVKERLKLMSGGGGRGGG